MNSKVDNKTFIAIFLKKVLHETFNGMQSIVAGRSLHCGTARTKKYIVFLTLTNYGDQIKSQLLQAVVLIN